MNIEEIHSLCRDKRLRWTDHIMIRLTQRGINISDVVYAILHGEIIEEYPTDYPYPSCLILCINVNNEPLHVVCGINGNTEIYLITAYRPDDEEWTNNYRTRKENI